MPQDRIGTEKYQYTGNTGDNRAYADSICTGAGFERGSDGKKEESADLTKILLKKIKIYDSTDFSTLLIYDQGKRLALNFNVKEKEKGG